MEEILKSWEKYGDGDKNKLAYILATAKWECGFVPREEKKARPGTELYKRQMKYWGWHGRGFVQLTHKENYAKFSKIFNVDLLSNPDLLITDIQLSADVLVYGMMKGSFTGKALKHFINTKEVDFINARRVVNGLDKANTIKELAIKFLKTL